MRPTQSGSDSLPVSRWGVSTGLKLDGRTGRFQNFSDAVELAKAGKKEEAKTRLRSILEVPNLEKSGDSHGASLTNYRTA